MLGESSDLLTSSASSRHPTRARDLQALEWISCCALLAKK